MLTAKGNYRKEYSEQQLAVMLPRKVSELPLNSDQLTQITPLKAKNLNADLISCLEM